MPIPPYELYPDQLRELCLGYALYEPSTNGDYDRMRIADVGYLDKGSFIRLFNIFVAHDDPLNSRFGIPQGFQPVSQNFQHINSRNPLTQGTYKSRSVRKISGNFDLGLSTEINTSLGNVELRLACSADKGAILLTKCHANQQFALCKNELRKYILRNCDAWFKFAREKGLGVDNMHDLILVTECTMTADWAIVTWDSSTHDLEASFSVGLPGFPSFEVGFWGRWEGQVGLPVRVGPYRDAATPQDGADRDQCIFFRGLRAVRRAAIMELLLKIVVINQHRPEDVLNAGHGSTERLRESTRPVRSYRIEAVDHRKPHPVKTIYDALACIIFYTSRADIAFIDDDDTDGFDRISEEEEDGTPILILHTHHGVIVTETKDLELSEVIGRIERASIRNIPKYTSQLDGLVDMLVLDEDLNLSSSDDSSSSIRELNARVNDVQQKKSRILPDGLDKPSQVMPEMQPYSNYIFNMEPGNSDTLVPGESQEDVFRQIGNSAAHKFPPSKYRFISRSSPPPPSPLRWMMTPISRPSRLHIQNDSVLGTSHIIAQLAKDVTDIAAVPFASQFVLPVLSLLEIAKGVKDKNDARVRLACTAATYLIQIRPILDHQGLPEDIPSELRLRLDGFRSVLIDLIDYLESLKRQSIMTRILEKKRILTTMLDHEGALQESFNVLQTVNAYALVRKDEKDLETGDIPRFDSGQIVLMDRLKFNGAFFHSELRANGNCQRVLVKRFANKTERGDGAKKWRRLWHPHIVKLFGCSNDRSTMQFIFFHDDILRNAAEVNSLAAFLLEFSRSHDVFSLVDTMVDFVNDACSAIRHMQVMLNFDEDETAGLALNANYTVDYCRRIIVVPPLGTSTNYGDGILNTICSSLLPSYGTSEASMQRYFAELDSSPPHATLTEVLDRGHLDKWAALDSIRSQLRTSPNGLEKPQQYVMPETRCAYVDYSVNIKPGDFGMLISGEDQEYAFRRVGNSAESISALIDYQSKHLLMDRNDADFEAVYEQPQTWRLDRLNDNSFFRQKHSQRLTHAAHLSKRFFRFSTPKDCDVDELVFVIGTQRVHTYQYHLRSESTALRRIADNIYASLPNRNTDDLHFRHCPPDLCPDNCIHPLDSQVDIEKNSEILRIEYVIVPVEKRAATLRSSAMSEENHEARISRFKEYETITQRPVLSNNKFWAEWP